MKTNQIVSCPVDVNYCRISIHSCDPHIKGRVWSTIMFCAWLAFAVKIVVAMTAKLNLAWFTRYEPRKQTVMTSLPSPSLWRALYNTMAFDPRKVLDEPNFATIEQNHIILFSVCCRHSILHVYEILLSEMKFLQKFCLLYTSPSPRDGLLSRMPSSA